MRVRDILRICEGVIVDFLQMFIFPLFSQTGTMLNTWIFKNIKASFVRNKYSPMSILRLSAFVKQTK